MYCKRTVEYMKAQRESRNFHEDKKLLNLYDNKLVDILGINAAYHIDFPTVKQLLYKLSSMTIRDKLCHGLDTVKAKYKDIYNTQNYVQTFRELLNITRIKIDEELDSITLNNFSSGFDYREDRHTGARSSRDRGRRGRNNVQVNRTGFNDNSQGGRNRNNQSNNWSRNKKRDCESSPEDDFPPNVNEYGDKLYNRYGTSYNRRSQMRKDIN